MTIIKYRPHRQLLADSMAEVSEVTSLDELVRRMCDPIKHWYPADKLPTVHNVKVEPYGFDERIGWNTYIVTVDGEAWGFTDGPLP